MNPCPADERWQEYAHDRLSPAEDRRLTRHLQTCPSCEETLARLVGPSPPQRGTGDALPTPPDLLESLRGLWDTPASSPEPTISEHWPTVEGYEIVGVLGRGGMGVVYRAIQRDLGRQVALKMVAAAERSSPADVRRLLNDATIAAGLRHPQIIPVYTVGQHCGVPYFVMELIDGGSLAQRLDDLVREPRQAARLVARVARALHHAHLQGVCHRDVKPANVLLRCRAGGAPDAEFGPRRHGLGLAQSLDDLDACLTDFGMAKRMTEGAGLTPGGALVGTPGYVAPELIRSGEPTPSADVFSLGALLFECLTGQAPFRAATPLDCLMLTAHDEPTRPRTLNSRLHRDLETVCLKCLEKDPRRRYPSAAAVADDLRRFVDGKPVVARPVGRLARGLRWCGRNRAVATLLAAVVLVTLAGLVSFAWAYRVAARRLADVEEANRRRVRAQVEGLGTAAAAAIPDQLRALDAQHAEALPHLRALWAEGGAKPERMRFALALLPDDPSLRDDVAAAMLAAADPREVLLLLDGLKPFAAELKEGLWRRASDKSAAAVARFRALVALSALDPADARWKDAGRPAVEQLLQANSLYLGDWSKALRPASAALVGPLGDVFRGKVQADKRRVAAEVLADYARNDPATLADLAADSDPEQFALLSPVLERNRERAAELLVETVRHRTPEGAPEVERIALARRQANAAAALVRLGAPEAAWPVLRHTPTPDARSYLVRDLAHRGVEAAALARRLDEEKDVSARRAMILALGEYATEQLPDEARKALVTKLLYWYRHDPDAGIHGAIDWLLRHGREGPVARKLDWGQGAALAAIDKELAGKSPAAGQLWYVAKAGFTMTVVRGPVEFWMGSPPGEAGRADNETRHRRRIGRTIAVATKPVTVAQFQEFLRTKPTGVETDYASGQSPEEECPINGENWYAAAKFCRWLSEKEGVAESEMCYPPGKDVKEGMKPYPDYLRRTGYRLLTEAEWEYACRAEAETAWFFGGDVELLPRYGWFIHVSGNRTWPVGQKRPNDLGLFDVHGHAWTWCQESAADYPPGTAANPAEDKEDIRDVKDDLNRLLRGGAYSYVAWTARSADRDSGRPSTRNGSVGLRVARTCR
jgi:formylglycine-generating enzyme required for sulfatase activity